MGIDDAWKKVSLIKDIEMLLTPLNSIIHHFHLSFTDLIVLIKERHHNSTALGTITFGEML